MAGKRSVFLINRPFQLRFAFYVCSWLIAMSFVYLLIIYNVFDYFFSYLALDPMGPTLARLQETRKEMLWLLIILQIILFTITFLVSIFMSHRIAGPLYKFSKFFGDVQAGNMSQKLVLRKKDHFQDLAADYNSMIGGLKGIIEKNVAEISTAIARLERAAEHASVEGKAELRAALDSLREVRERLPH